MTKRNLAEQIFETGYHAENKKEAVNSIISFLDLLEPKDRQKFSEWGFNKDLSTPEKCWI